MRRVLLRGAGRGIPSGHMTVLRQGPAMRVVFFYSGEEGTYVDNVGVTVFDNGIVHIINDKEDTMTHIQNVEILWRFSTDEDRTQKFRLLKLRPVTEEGQVAPPPEGGDNEIH